jgi:hypothetical protein
MKYENLTEDEKKMLAEAVWRRQRSFIAGDKQFNAYGKILDEILNSLDDYVPGKIL